MDINKLQRCNKITIVEYLIYNRYIICIIAFEIYYVAFSRFFSLTHTFHRVILDSDFWVPKAKDMRWFFEINKLICFGTTYSDCRYLPKVTPSSTHHTLNHKLHLLCILCLGNFSQFTKVFQVFDKYNRKID